MAQQQALAELFIWVNEDLVYPEDLSQEIIDLYKDDDDDASDDEYEEEDWESSDDDEDWESHEDEEYDDEYEEDGWEDDSEDDSIEHILLKGHVLVDNEHCMLLLTNKRWLTYQISSVWNRRFGAFLIFAIDKIPLVGKLLAYLMLRSRIRKKINSQDFLFSLQDLMSKEDKYWLKPDKDNVPIVDLSHELFYSRASGVHLKQKRFSKGLVLSLIPKSLSKVLQLPEDPVIYFSEHFDDYKRTFATLMGELSPRDFEFAIEESKHSLELYCIDSPEPKEDSLTTPSKSKQLWYRTKTTLYEGVISAFIFLILGFIIGIIYAEVNGLDVDKFGDSSLGQSIALVTTVLGMWLYPALLIRLSGATWGKGAYGIMIIQKDGSPASWLQALVRPWMKLLFTIPLAVGYWPCLFGKQALHDQILGLQVIHENDPALEALDINEDEFL